MTQGYEQAESGTKSSDELRADLDETRERVSSDVEALTNKLSPENLKAEAKQAVSRSWEEGKELVRDKLHLGTARVREKLHEGTERVKETVENTETTVLGYMRENPVPLALIGAGIGLLLLSAKKRTRAAFTYASKRAISDPRSAKSTRTRSSAGTNFA
jgi:ElaB/YqjD/DUF883 family membrane-anchored ribosome-binding protein